MQPYIIGERYSNVVSFLLVNSYYGVVLSEASGLVDCARPASHPAEHLLAGIAAGARFSRWPVLLALRHPGLGQPWNRQPVGCLVRSRLSVISRRRGPVGGIATFRAGQGGRGNYNDNKNSNIKPQTSYQYYY